LSDRCWPIHDRNRGPHPEIENRRDRPLNDGRANRVAKLSLHHAAHGPDEYAPIADGSRRSTQPDAGRSSPP
jgi:hypothetical protein